MWLAVTSRFEISIMHLRGHAHLWCQKRQIFIFIFFLSNHTQTWWYNMSALTSPQMSALVQLTKSSMLLHCFIRGMLSCVNQIWFATSTPLTNGEPKSDISERTLDWHHKRKGAPLTRVDPSVGGDGGDGEGGDGGDDHGEEDDDAGQHCRPRQSASYVNVEDTSYVNVEDT